MANSTTGFILGVLTVIAIGVGIYLYMDFTKSETRVADYSADENDLGEDTYIYDKDDAIMEDAINDSIDENLNDDVPAGNGFITGRLCYPSHFLPPGEIVAKNISTQQITEIDFDGTTSEYKIGVTPGTYNIRYQAHAFGNDEFSSGYYTKCGVEATVEACDAEGGHDLIPVEVSAGEIAGGVTLCDFYYEENPDF